MNRWELRKGLQINWTWTRAANWYATMYKSKATPSDRMKALKFNSWVIEQVTKLTTKNLVV